MEQPNNGAHDPEPEKTVVVVAITLSPLDSSAMWSRLAAEKEVLVVPESFDLNKRSSSSAIFIEGSEAAHKLVLSRDGTWCIKTFVQL